MYNFIFDIDDTLYQNKKLTKPLSQDIFHLYYLYNNEKNKKKQINILEKIVLRYKKSFQYDYKLNQLIKNIPYPIHIITNSRNIHCFTTLYLIGIIKKCKVILTAETQQQMKPYPQVYNYFEKLQNNNYKNIFFDDRPENLIYPKKKGWITVLINDKSYKTNYIDFVFPDIYQALEFFNKNM